MPNPPDARRDLAAARLVDRPRIRTGASETELAIFRATETLLEQRPFAELSVAQILEGAGLSRASFYHYFSSKLGVVAGLLVNVMDEVFAVASPFLTRPAMTMVESLRVSINSALELWGTHRVLLRVVMEHWPASPELEIQWQGAMSRFADAIAAEVDALREQGALPPGLPSIELARALVWSTERCLYIAGRGNELELPGEQAWSDTLVTLWAGTLQLGSPQS
ncbi:TetR/AcrR family transcriptional regulator [Mycobacterium vicinigordonae]|uniref:TetR/AcrR family transcriptional regulator n=1 Tax=Mycobacterium vicinigordonae TaxID=1719132 RepID=A0A7D6HWR4_9MYCO|nr:TetR/AcrR family transcriptional regulator [Mycobacterium vicinigordonae]QLL06375.1 TetR/AcrR family transcriptional regulator [Mycobacterium vicinigordonae]